MDGFDVWDWLLLSVVAYVAVMALVRLMAGHRKKVTDELMAQIEAEQARKKREAKRKQGHEDQAA